MSSQGNHRSRKAPASVFQLLANSPLLCARTAGISASEWQSIVGRRLAERASIEQVTDGVLTVRVPSSTWAQELSFLSHMVLERLQSSGHPVSKIRFRVAMPSRSTAEPPRQSVSRAPLPGALRARLADLEDPTLRDAIAEAAALSLGRQKPSR